MQNLFSLKSNFSPRNLFLISFAILFLEMACIRWMNSSITVLAYFNNLILISCFFGLGVGCLLAKKKIHLIQFVPIGFLLFVLAVLGLNQFNIDISYSEDIIFAGNAEYYQSGLLKVPISALIGFLINVSLFVLLGQELGKQLDAVKNPLVAYAYDIGGSLIGVLAYTALAWFQTPPHLWYACGLFILLIFLRGPVRLVLSTLIIIVTVFLITKDNADKLWSPYYKIETQEYQNDANKNLGFMIIVDNLRIQDALKVSPELMQSELRWWAPYYKLPYKITQPKKVLVLGGGSGNEAVFALSNGAEEVHVVEIDPIIANFGKTLHPHAPYKDPRVKIITDDARSYISNTNEKYDLIVMSALDSHKQIGGMTSIRLESFVYTVESYARIKTLLKSDGVFCLNLASPRAWAIERTYQSLVKAFGADPSIFTTPNSPFQSIAYVYGPENLLTEAANKKDSGIIPVSGFDNIPEHRLATDDWPYLYLQTNKIPNLSLVVLVFMIIASTLIVFLVEPAVRKPNFHFFFLGAGFMLLETRSITQMALLFGTTWIVNSIVFAAILLTIFIANLLVYKNKAPNNKLSYWLLFLSLIFCYFFPFNYLLEMAVVPRMIASCLVIGLPIIWASFIFSNSFRNVKNINVVFGSNLLGIVLGGCLEYTTNIWGMSMLYLFAAVIYFGSLICKPKG